MRIEFNIKNISNEPKDVVLLTRRPFIINGGTERVVPTNGLERGGQGILFIDANWQKWQDAVDAWESGKAISKIMVASTGADGNLMRVMCPFHIKMDSADTIVTIKSEFNVGIVNKGNTAITFSAHEKCVYVISFEIEEENTSTADELLGKAKSIKHSKKEEPLKMTVAEAILSGYTHFCEDGGESMRKLSDGFDEDEIQKLKEDENWQVFWLLKTEPSFYSISAEAISDAIYSQVESQDEFGDEDGDLCDIVKEVHDKHPELFEALSEKLNEAYKSKKFFHPSDIQIIP